MDIASTGSSTHSPAGSHAYALAALARSLKADAHAAAYGNKSLSVTDVIYARMSTQIRDYFGLVQAGPRQTCELLTALLETPIGENDIRASARINLLGNHWHCRETINLILKWGLEDVLAPAVATYQAASARQPFQVKRRPVPPAVPPKPQATAQQRAPHHAAAITQPATSEASSPRSLAQVPLPRVAAPALQAQAPDAYIASAPRPRRIVARPQQPAELEARAHRAAAQPAQAILRPVRDVSSAPSASASDDSGAASEAGTPQDPTPARPFATNNPFSQSATQVRLQALTVDGAAPAPLLQPMRVAPPTLIFNPPAPFPHRRDVPAPPAPAVPMFVAPAPFLRQVRVHPSPSRNLPTLPSVEAAHVDVLSPPAEGATPYQSHTPEGEPPPYSFEDHSPPQSPANAPGPLHAEVDDDWAIAQAMQVSEEDDYAFAVQLQFSEDAANAAEALGAASLASDARMVGGVSIPASLVNPATQSIFQNPMFHIATGRTLDGPSDASAALPAGHVADYALRDVLEAWAQYHDQDEARLGVALQDALTCSITQELFVSPVITADGSTYEEADIRQWLAGNGKSPKTRQTMAMDQVWPARTITALMQEYGMLAASGAQVSAVDAITESATQHVAISNPLAGIAGPTDVADIVAGDVQAALPHLRRSHRQIPDRYTSGMRLSTSNNKFDRIIGNMHLTSCISGLNELITAFEGRQTQSLFQAWVADCYRVKKEYGTAISKLREALVAWPTEDALRARLAFLYAITGELEESEAYGASIMDSTLQCYVLAARGEAHRRRGQFSPALQCFAEADASEYAFREVAAWRKLASKRQRTPVR